jgi:hypothetical protein
VAYIIEGHRAKGDDIKLREFSRQQLWRQAKQNPITISFDLLHRAHRENRLVAIYPEVVSGNPLGVSRVVRWVLLVPPPVITQTWAPTDLIVAYQKAYIHLHNRLPNIRRPLKIDVNLMYTFLDYDYQNHNQHRQGTCFTTRKAFYFEAIGCGPLKLSHDPVGSFCFEPQHNLRPKELEILFNRCETFYSYDPFTFHVLIAAMCGCLVIIKPMTIMSAQEFQSWCPLARYGIAYGDTPEQRKHAEQTRHLVKPLVKSAIQENNKNIRRAMNQIHKLICA